MEQTWLLCNELAAHFRVQPATIRKWTREGLPHLKCGRLVRFNAEAAQRWLEQRQSQGGEGGEGTELSVTDSK